MTRVVNRGALSMLPAAVAQRIDLRAAAELTAYATALRYPSDDDPVTPDEHRRAVELAGTVVEWAERKTA